MEREIREREREREGERREKERKTGERERERKRGRVEVVVFYQGVGRSDSDIVRTSWSPRRENQHACFGIGSFTLNTGAKNRTTQLDKGGKKQRGETERLKKNT